VQHACSTTKFVLLQKGPATTNRGVAWLHGRRTAKARTSDKSGRRISYQVNIDENDPEELFTILVKDQELLVSSVLSKLQVRTKDILSVEASTGRVSEDFLQRAIPDYQYHLLT